MEEKKYEIEVPLSYGSLCIDGSNLIIVQKKSEEIIPIANIQSFYLSEPKGYVRPRGKIKFTTAAHGTVDIVNLGFGISSASDSGRQFVYYEEDYEAAKQMRDYISNFNSTPKNVNVQPHKEEPVSTADEIRKLKALLDEGILTQEEFAAKKKQLLNL